MEIRCPSCKTPVPGNARYCPKCGELANTAPLPPAISPDAISARGALPRAGKIFLLVGMLGLGLLLTGLITRNLTVSLVGAGVVGTLIVTILAGDLFS